MAEKAGKKEAKELARTRPAALLPAWEREVDRFFDRLLEDFRRGPWSSLLRTERWLPSPPFETGAPAVDVFEENDEVVVKADLPGISKDDLHVTVTGDRLTIQGEKKKTEEVRERGYYRSERAYGAFGRTIELPAEVKPDEVKATFKDGVLQIRLPKSEAAKKKQIAVKVE